MGIWRTEKNPSGYEVNIVQSSINCMKEKGARFCWFKDNIGIDNKNSDFYEDSDGEDSGKGKRLRENITVVDDGGFSHTGYVTHIVNGSCLGTNIENWFIFQPGTYPTIYIIEPHHNEVIVTDL